MSVATPTSHFQRKGTRKVPDRGLGHIQEQVILVLACLMSLALPAMAAPLAVPNDGTATYILLQRHDLAGSATLLVRRVGADGVSYFERRFDCQTRIMSASGSGDSLQAVRRSKGGPFRVPIAEGSVDHDLWKEACAGQTPKQKRMAEHMAEDGKRMLLERRIQELRPRRRERPLRSTNIDDREVVEIQSVMADFFPGAIVNIGGVVSGCPCEDGASCSAQVWVAAYTPEKTLGLLLSRISGSGHVGPVQNWWLDYEALHTGRSRLSNSEEDALTDRFPKCAAQPSIPADAGGARPRP
jgi:hypothetical protein